MIFDPILAAVEVHLSREWTETALRRAASVGDQRRRPRRRPARTVVTPHADNDASVQPAPLMCSNDAAETPPRLA
jgi:hypothetical protein